ncbi:10413_t:CDS:2 [Entrophospora sp. SA101]|nr:10413_t:CDS:2 [Entrophospora sp. SA101]
MFSLVERSAPGLQLNDAMKVAQLHFVPELDRNMTFKLTNNEISVVANK